VDKALKGMNSGWSALRSGWLDAMKRWHRYSARGIEHLRTPGAKLLIGYHGRGMPLDLALLAEEVRRLEGYIPHCIVHEGLWRIPLAKSYLEAHRAIPGDGPELRAAISRGETVFIAPGGTYEGLRSFWHRHVVDWGNRRGYLRLALELGIPLVPAATAGVDDRFIGLNDGHELGRRLKLPARWPLWIALGPLGVYPFTVDFPVKFHTVIGEPIHLSPPADMDAEWLDATHGMITTRVQRVLDEALSDVSRE
jgi:1-acyl-sn-glycerol-3-phosphate acyltransferase